MRISTENHCTHGWGCIIYRAGYITQHIPVSVIHPHNQFLLWGLILNHSHVWLGSFWLNFLPCGAYVYVCNLKEILVGVRNNTDGLLQIHPKEGQRTEGGDCVGHYWFVWITPIHHENNSFIYLSNSPGVWNKIDGWLQNSSKRGIMYRGGWRSCKWIWFTTIHHVKTGFIYLTRQSTNGILAQANIYEP